MGELDDITINLGLCLYISTNPNGKIWDMCERYRDETDCIELKRIMNRIRKDPRADLTVKYVTSKLLGFKTN